MHSFCCYYWHSLSREVWLWERSQQSLCDVIKKKRKKADHSHYIQISYASKLEPHTCVLGLIFLLSALQRVIWYGSCTFVCTFTWVVIVTEQECIHCVVQGRCKACKLTWHCQVTSDCFWCKPRYSPHLICIHTGFHSNFINKFLSRSVPHWMPKNEAE